MKVVVKDDQCISCGYCEGVCDKVFELRDDDDGNGTISHVLVDTVPDDCVDSVVEAIEGCPSSAIEEVK